MQVCEALVMLGDADAIAEAPTPAALIADGRLSSHNDQGSHSPMMMSPMDYCCPPTVLISATGQSLASDVSVNVREGAEALLLAAATVDSDMMDIASDNEEDGGASYDEGPKMDDTHPAAASETEGTDAEIALSAPVEEALELDVAMADLEVVPMAEQKAPEGSAVTSDPSAIPAPVDDTIQVMGATPCTNDVAASSALGDGAVCEAFDASTLLVVAAGEATVISITPESTAPLTDEVVEAAAELAAVVEEADGLLHATAAADSFGNHGDMDVDMTWVGDQTAPGEHIVEAAVTVAVEVTEELAAAVPSPTEANQDQVCMPVVVPDNDDASEAFDAQQDFSEGSDATMPTMAALEAWLASNGIVPTESATDATPSPLPEAFKQEEGFAPMVMAEEGIELMPHSPVTAAGGTDGLFLPASPIVFAVDPMGAEGSNAFASPVAMAFEPIDLFMGGGSVEKGEKMLASGGFLSPAICNGVGFTFDTSMAEVPPLESTPSPVASLSNSPRVIVQVGVSNGGLVN